MMMMMMIIPSAGREKKARSFFSSSSFLLFFNSYLLWFFFFYILSFPLWFPFGFHYYGCSTASTLGQYTHLARNNIEVDIRIVFHNRHALLFFPPPSSLRTNRKFFFDLQHKAKQNPNTSFPSVKRKKKKKSEWENHISVCFDGYTQQQQPTPWNPGVA